jgi:hypothetical protein
MHSSKKSSINRSTGSVIVLVGATKGKIATLMFRSRAGLESFLDAKLFRPTNQNPKSSATILPTTAKTVARRNERRFMTQATAILWGACFVLGHGAGRMHDDGASTGTAATQVSCRRGRIGRFGIDVSFVETRP